MKTIKFKGKEYPVRTMDVVFNDSSSDENISTITIAPESLLDAIIEVIGENFDYELDESGLSWDIDQSIYMYFDEVEFNSTAQEICEKYLDIIAKLISEEI